MEAAGAKSYMEKDYYIKTKKGSCKVYPTPFAVKLHEDWKTIVEPDISVICDFQKLTEWGCTGAPNWIIDQEKVKVNLYDNFWTDFQEIDVSDSRGNI